MPESTRIVYTRWKCPVCGNEYESKDWADVCAAAAGPVDLPAVGAEVHLKNRSPRTYTAARVKSVRIVPSAEVTCWSKASTCGVGRRELLALARKESHDFVMLLEESVCLYHKWDGCHSEIPSFYLLREDGARTRCDNS